MVHSVAIARFPCKKETKPAHEGHPELCIKAIVRIFSVQYITITINGNKE
jgi:hypothetical protein